MAAVVVVVRGTVGVEAGGSEEWEMGHLQLPLEVGAPENAPGVQTQRVSVN